MDTLKEKLTEILHDRLQDSYDCTRDWSGWHYRTMTHNDFNHLPDDDERIEEIVDDIIEAVMEGIR